MVLSFREDRILTLAVILIGHWRSYHGERPEKRCPCYKEVASAPPPSDWGLPTRRPVT